MEGVPKIVQFGSRQASWPGGGTFETCGGV